MNFISSVPLTIDVPLGADQYQHHSTAVWVYPANYVGTTTHATETTPQAAATTPPLATQRTQPGADPRTLIRDLTTDARPILFFHGFRGDHHGMELIAHHMRTHPVIVPDIPGFGSTPPLPGGVSLDGYVAFLDGFVHELTEACGIEPLVVGHSFGSIITAHWAATHPTAPGLVLINPITVSPLDGPSKALTKLIQLYYKLGRDLPTRLSRTVLANAVVVRAMSQLMVTTHDRGLRAYIHDQHAKYFSTYSDPTSLAEAFEVSVSYTATEVASRLTMPVLVIAGNKDSIAPLTPTQEFIAQLPNAHARVFDGVGHLVHYERPEETAIEIETFLSHLDK